MSKTKKSNVRLAGIFILFVTGLILVSLFLKVLFVFRESKFDGKHQYNVIILSENSAEIISLSPPTRSIAILRLNRGAEREEIIKNLRVPLDGEITTRDTVSKNNLSSIFFKSLFPFGNRIRGMNLADSLRVFLYTRGILPNAIYYRELSDSLNEQQKSTLISLSFTDPTIYQENQSIEIVNATNIYGLGNRLASLITNIGGNVILVTSPQEESKESKIIYSGEKSYTVERISKILNYQISKTEKKSIADVIIIIGKDSLEINNF